MERLYKIVRMAAIVFFTGIALALVIAAIVRWQGYLLIGAFLYWVLGLIALQNIDDMYEAYKEYKGRK